MEVNAINKKTYMLTDEGQQLGELNYKSLFSYNAEIKLTNAEKLTRLNLSDYLEEVCLLEKMDQKLPR
jgi:hypothetical protein